MIATHNIKVNGRWIHAGEHYELPGQAKEPEKAAPVKPEEEKPAEAVAEAPEKVPEKPVVPARTTRRKASK